MPYNAGSHNRGVTLDGETRATASAKAAVSDDVQFFEFARRHLTLVTSIASIPIVSSLTGVLPPPDTDTKSTKLTVISSLLCLIVFSACFLMRGPLRHLTEKKGFFWRWLPAMLTVAFCSVAVLSTAFYVETYATFTATLPGSPHGPELFKLTLLYLAIFPCYVTGLGVVLITAFSQQLSLKITEHILTREQSRVFADTVQNYFNFLSLSDGGTNNKAFGQIGRDLLDALPEQMASLARGEIIVSGSQTPKLQRMLHEHFRGRFDAVSNDDLEFWLSLDTDRLAMDYFRLNTDAVESGTEVTRVFIVAEKDLEPSRRQGLIDVLRRHDQARIGWAVAIHEELDPPLLQDHKAALDFALMVHRGSRNGPNDVGAASFFRDYREIRRQYSAVFKLQETSSTSESQDDQIQINRDRIWRHVRQHRLLITQCWMASSLFKEKCQTILNGAVPEINSAVLEEQREPTDYETVAARIRASATALRNRLMETESHAQPPSDLALGALGAELATGQLFLVEVDSIKEIAGAVEKLYRLRRASKDWFRSNALRQSVPVGEQP